MRREDDHSGFRHIRLQTLILEEVRALLRDDVTDPTLEPVRLTALVLSVDYRHARVHFAVRATEDDARKRRTTIEHALARATPFLRARLAETIDLKRVPDLRFVFDGAAVASEAP